MWQKSLFTIQPPLFFCDGQRSRKKICNFKLRTVFMQNIQFIMKTSLNAANLNYLLRAASGPRQSFKLFTCIPHTHTHTCTYKYIHTYTLRGIKCIYTIRTQRYSHGIENFCSWKGPPTINLGCAAASPILRACTYTLYARCTHISARAFAARQIAAIVRDS